MTKRLEPEHWEKHLTRLQLRQGGFSKELMHKVKERVETKQPPVGSKRWLRWSPAVACVLVLAVGWTQADRLIEGLSKLSKPLERAALEAMDPNKEKTLKVSFVHETTFMMQYGKAFTIRYPNVTVKVETGIGSEPYAAIRTNLEEQLEKDKPDVLALSLSEYAQLAKEGKLYALDDVIRQEGFDLQNIHAGVVDRLRTEGGGKLYGLAPEYDQRALFYNKELFDKYGISYPKNGMSWEELLQLASRFPAAPNAKDRVYGLVTRAYSGPFGLVQQAGQAKGLSILDSSGKQVTVNTPEWQKVWTAVLDAVRGGYIYEQPPLEKLSTREDMYRANPFMTGQAAMTLQSYGFVKDLNEASSRYKMSSVPWDVVIEPTDPSRPNESSSFSVRTIYAVNATSENRREAWELVKFINSEDTARKMLTQNIGSGTSPSRLSSLSAVKGQEKLVEAFTSPRPPAESQETLGVPAEFYSAFQELATQLSKDVLKGKKTVSQATRELQDNGQQALIQAKNAAQKKPVKAKAAVDGGTP
ncbi:ABC transporter substrate-binding protein [Paenibacillus tyrfis]|uniref:ABC transporter substrate-binding protein n=1 Tax=Paenibacillus tyrfis TaxID=1501230 RepID=UPI000B59250A|nr:extracellular solute-binding protein [Paenibacillus tyrfis]